MHCKTCGHRLIFDIIDEEEIVWCPYCGKAYENDEESEQAELPGTARES